MHWEILAAVTAVTHKELNEGPQKASSQTRPTVREKLVKLVMLIYPHRSGDIRQEEDSKANTEDHVKGKKGLN